MEIGEKSIKKDSLPQHQVKMISHDLTDEEAWRPWKVTGEEEVCEASEKTVFPDTNGVASKFSQTILAQQFFDSLGFSENQVLEASKAITVIVFGKAYNPIPK